MADLDSLSPTPRSESFVNVAKYGEYWHEPREIGVKWDDPRHVYAVLLRFKSSPKDLSEEDVKIQYWQHHWPRFRGPVGAGGSGWGPIDDFYNGQWKDANFALETDEDRWLFTFSPVNREFPEFGDFNVKYRRTLKVRAISSRDLTQVENFEVYTDSLWRRMDVSIEWGSEDAPEKVWDSSVEVYNGELADLKPLRAASKVRIVSADSWASTVQKGETDGVKVAVWYCHNDKSGSYDETVVTIRSKAHSFSFSMNDLENGERIFLKDYHVLVSRSSDDVELKVHANELAQSGLSTVYDLINSLPEQTLERAWEEMPAKKRGMHFIVSCKGRRQKFGISTRGAVFCPKLWNVQGRTPEYRLRSKYADRFLWERDTIAYSFGFPDVEPEKRHLLEGSLPIIYARWVEDGIMYEQEAFATLLFKDVLDDLEAEKNIDGDDPVACMVKITLTSQSPSRKKVNLKLASVSKEQWRDLTGVSERLEYRDGLIFALFRGGKPEQRLRYFLNTKGRGNIQAGYSLDSFPERYLAYELQLDPGESHTVYAKIPFITLLENSEFERLKGLDYDAERPKAIEYWHSLLSKGAKIEVPEEWLSNYYRAYPSHVHITDDKEPNSERYICRVSSFFYGFFPNESAMVISELDRRGLHEEAERRLDVFTHYQGTALPAGRYSTKDGVFYGAGGYECGQYGQHHGWSLWVLAEHYKYSRDKDWLKRVAPSIVKGCDWVISERRSTMKTDDKGRRSIEWGFMPPGGLEDVVDFWHWLVTNAHAWRGLSAAAEVLKEIDHPEAARLSEEAQAYRMDLLTGITEAGLRSPVVKLRDGTWVPHFPSRLRRRGRDLGWIRETLEGSMHSLLLCGLIDPSSKEADWIVKDYEDNLHISEQYGYAVPDFDRYWFSRGGFSMQPNLYGFQIPYLWRDDVKHYLRAFLNSFAVAFYPETRMLTEHPLPTMADWAGDHFKTSDEAICCYCLRLALIYEKGEDFILLPAVPREWLEDRKQISVGDAATYFGKVSFKVESKVSEGLIEMTLNPPRRNPPRSINVRFRHPNKLKIHKVEVDGKEWADFDSDKELITLGHIEEQTRITVYY